MHPDLLLVKNISPAKSLLEHVFSFDVNKLELLSDIDLSKFVIALSQYLVYFKYELNKTTMRLKKEQQLLEVSISQLLTDDIIKKYKTKKDARIYLVYNNAVLNGIQLKIDTLNDELILLEGLDRTIQELINSFKRELTRREHEAQYGRHS